MDTLHAQSSIFLNFIGCATLLFIAYLPWKRFNYVLTVDILIQLIVATIYEQQVRLCRKKPYDEIGKAQRESPDTSKTTWGQGSVPLNVASIVVGWREEEDLFRACLESYKHSAESSFMIVGVDGDEPADYAMIDIFKKTFPSDACTIHFRQPLGSLLNGARKTPVLLKELPENTLKSLCVIVKGMIVEQIFPRTLQDIKRLCIYQPHQCKKDILFSALVVGLIVGEELGIEFIWSSDSDSIAEPLALQKTLSIVQYNEHVGGACCRLRFQNKVNSVMSKMEGARYWFNQDTPRTQVAICRATECQPGPCAMFRNKALSEVLLKWYGQTVWGKRMITNEDRHLTTSLLRHQWEVLYAPDAIVITDTPGTLSGWIKQQVRWSRGTYVETFHRPIFYLQKHPWFFLSVFRDRAFPIVQFVLTLCFVFKVQHINLAVLSTDLVLRVACQFLYTLRRCYEKPNIHDLIWFIPSIIFNMAMGPGIAIWALATIFESSWGTTMRSSLTSNQKERISERLFQLGFQILWIGVLGGAIVRGLEASDFYQFNTTTWNLLVALVSAFTSFVTFGFLFVDLYYEKSKS